jgi:hypothetical protein
VARVAILFTFQVCLDVLAKVLPKKKRLPISKKLLSYSWSQLRTISPLLRIFEILEIAV